jgi:hypothetical protein
VTRVHGWFLGLLGGLALLACAASDEGDEPRPELEGDVGGAAAGGAPPTGGGGATATTSATTSTTATTTTGAGGGCDVSDEPNDSEATAKTLPAINDCDGNGSNLVGTLDGADDVDWFRYQGSDDFGCVVDPTRALTADGGLRLCKFAECLSGVAEVTCENGSTPAVSPKGNPGCCHSQGFGIDIDCPGIDDDAIILMRLDQGQSPCVGYTVAYHY